MNRSLAVLRLLVSFLFVFLVSYSVKADEYQIGVYYYPGWKNQQPHAISSLPWNAIKNFPEREPLLGWYNEGSDVNVVHKQIDWMSEYGIDYVVYDWYWGKDNIVYLEHALAAFMSAPNRTKLKFSLLWANHDGAPVNRENFQRMVEYWVRFYFKRSEYLKIENKPVIFIYSAEFLKKDAEKFGATSKELLDLAQTIAIKAGFPGIHFVAGANGLATPIPIMESYASSSGYLSFSTYNFHQNPLSPLMSHSYAELDLGYQEWWKRFSTFGSLPLIVPMTSGWDKRPWGGSKDPLHDNSLSTPEEFEAHLRAAKNHMDDSSQNGFFPKMGVICCWNEFGEGSFIEPTKAQGYSYLEKVKQVFGGGVP